MIHYHGLPITPATAAATVLTGRHAFVSFAAPGQLEVAVDVCQSFAADCGAFSAWRNGNPITDWAPYYDWAGALVCVPSFDWAVVPDIIDGDERANDQLVAEWPLPRHVGVPVWHMHESIGRLQRLCAEWPRVALGSSGAWSRPGSPEWWVRMGEALAAICDREGRPAAKLHGMRMLNPAVFSRLPLVSADSTNVGRNIGIDKAWRGTYQPASKEWRALVLASRIESVNGAGRWEGEPAQFDVFGREAA